MATSTALLEGLNPNQSQAVQTHDGPVMLIAGPGSGKTRVLTHRVAALVEKGVDAHRILAVTFTNQAAREMRERLADLIGTSAQTMWITTFHSLCARILREDAHLVNLPRNYTILDATESRNVLRELLDQHKLFDSELETAGTRQKSKFTKSVAAIISELKNHNKPPEVLELTTSETYAAANIYHPYQAALQARGSVDFDDLLLKTVELLTTHPEVQKRYQTQFQYIHIDEFQDTNEPQWEIVRLLGQAHRNVLVVGDPDQAIYGFRGARPNVFDTFVGTFAPVTDIRLGQNYRSTGNIVAVAQAAIQGNPTNYRADLSTSNPAGEQVTHLDFATGLDEATYLAHTLKTSTRPLGDHAILVRTNMQTRALEQAFTKQGIAYDLVGMTRFFERTEIKDATSYLRLLVNPNDHAAFDRATAVPRRGFGPTLRTRVLQAHETTPHPDGLIGTLRTLIDTLPRGRRPITEFISTYDHLAHVASQKGLTETLHAIYDAGLYAYYEEQADKTAEHHRVENLDELISAAVEFEKENPPNPQFVNPHLETIAEFLHRAALTSSAEVDTTTSHVQIATIHSAKGKEWPVVFVVGVEEGTLPHARSYETLKEMQEERRLFFVALSRAQQRLYVTTAATRMLHGTVSEQDPSQFLSEIAPQLKRTSAKARPKSPFPQRTSPRPTSRVASTTTPTHHWAVGDEVFHHKFGDGVILNVSPKELTVKFSDRQLLLHPIIAPLVKR